MATSENNIAAKVTRNAGLNFNFRDMRLARIRQIGHIIPED